MITREPEKYITLFEQTNLYNIITEANKEHLKSIIRLTVKNIKQHGILLKFSKELKNLEDNVIFSSISEHIMFQDTNHRIIWANKFAAETLGLELKDMIGKYCYELWHNRSTPCEDCPVKIALEKKGFYEDIAFSETSKRWYHRKSYPVFDDKGNILGAIEIAQNITERKKLEDELKEKEEILKLIFENSNDIIYSYRLTEPLGFEYVSPSVEKILGYSPEEHYKDPLLGNKLVHPDDQHILNAYIQKGGIYNEPVVLRFIKKNGDIVLIEQVNKKVLNEKGEPIKLIGIGRDITARKVYEKELIIKERFLSTLLSNLPGIVCIFKNDEKWTMKYLSGEIENITGYKAEDLLYNKQISFVEIIHPEDRKNVSEVVSNAIKDKKNFKVEYRIITKNNEEKWVLERGKGVFEGEKLLHIQGYIYDITPYKTLIREKEFYFKELQHRIKNSFNLVVALINLELSGENEISRESLEKLRNRIFSISAMYDLLYKYSNVDSIEIGEYLSKIIDYIKNSLSEEKDVEINFYPEKLYLSPKKATSLGIVLNEMIINSLKYSFDKNGKIEIYLKLNKDKFNLSIYDNGKPFPKDFLQEKFKKGFGLKMIKMLIEEMGGKIEIKTKEKIIKIEVPIENL